MKTKEQARGLRPFIDTVVRVYSIGEERERGNGGEGGMGPWLMEQRRRRLTRPDRVCTLRRSHCLGGSPSPSRRRAVPTPPSWSPQRCAQRRAVTETGRTGREHPAASFIPAPSMRRHCAPRHPHGNTRWHNAPTHRQASPTSGAPCSYLPHAAPSSAAGPVALVEGCDGSCGGPGGGRRHPAGR